MKRSAKEKEKCKNSYRMAIEANGGESSISNAVQFAKAMLIPKGVNPASIDRYIYTLLEEGNDSFYLVRPKTIALKKNQIDVETFSQSEETPKAPVIVTVTRTVTFTTVTTIQ